MFPGKQKPCKGDADKPAMKRHAAVPEHQRGREGDDAKQRLPCFHQQRWLVEKDIAKPSAGNNPDRNPEKYVVKKGSRDRCGVLGPEFRVGDQARQIPPAAGDAGNIGQRVPADREGADFHENRVDIWVGNGHERRRSDFVRLNTALRSPCRPIGFTFYIERERNLAMQTQSAFFDAIAKMMTEVAGAADGARREAETVFRSQVERLVADMDFVSREEFEVVRDMARAAREENESLKARIEALEQNQT